MSKPNEDLRSHHNTDNQPSTIYNNITYNKIVLLLLIDINYSLVEIVTL